MPRPSPGAAAAHLDRGHVFGHRARAMLLMGGEVGAAGLVGVGWGDGPPQHPRRHRCLAQPPGSVLVLAHRQLPLPSRGTVATGTILFAGLDVVEQ